MKTTKKLTAILTFTLALSAAVQAQFSYTINVSNTNTVTITGYTGPPWAVTIPSDINGLLVTGIGVDAFASNGSLSSVTIPGSVASIGDGAFDSCVSLTTVTIGNGVTSIGAVAFYDCLSLSSVAIPGSVTSIGAGAFTYDGSLSSVTIGNGVTSIGAGAFTYCGDLTGITIPASVTSIGEDAFYGCVNISVFYFKGNAPTVGVNVFGDDNIATIYYLPGTTGWSSPFAGLPAVLLLIPGSLKVTIGPAPAITAGAEWQVDSGLWQKSGATVSNLAAGKHTLRFNTISGWTTPANRTVSVKANSVAKATGTYIFSAQGIYSGLFMQPDAPAQTNGFAYQSSGFFTATITKNGGYSGKIQQAGKMYSLNGTFGVTGLASNLVTPSGLNPLTVLLQLDLSGSDTLTGQISGGTWTAALTANRATFNARTNAAPQAGKYTLSVPGSDDSAVLPGGDGFGAVTVAPSGNVTFSGTLGDGTRVSQATTLSKNGLWPFYASLYSGKGCILGWLTFSNETLVNIVTDFSTNANPNGVWSYGWATALGQPFQLATNPLPEGATATAGWDNGLTEPDACYLIKDFTNFFTNGTVAFYPDTLHMDPQSYAAMARFTAPSNGNYQVSGLFRLEDTNTQPHDLTIVVNGNTTNFSVFTAGGTYNTEYPFNFSTALTQGETLDFVVSCFNGDYGNLGTGLKVNIADLTGSQWDIGGSPIWIKLPQPNAKYYPAGFINETTAIGSRYIFTKGVPILNFNAGHVWLAGGDLTESFTNSIFFEANKVTNLSSNRLAVTIAGPSGLFTGSVVNPFTGKLISISGAVLQKQNRGTGVFLGTDQSGQVYFGQ